MYETHSRSPRDTPPPFTEEVGASCARTDGTEADQRGADNLIDEIYLL